MGGSSSGGSRRSIGDIRSLEQKAKEVLQRGKKNVFISFSHKDLDEVNLLRAHAKNENSDIEFNDRSVYEPYDSERAEYIRSRLGDRINQASTTVVYLSDSTADSRWVTWEIEKSVELSKRIIAVHSGDKPPAKMPSWVAKHEVKVVPWKRLAEEL